MRQFESIAVNVFTGERRGDRLAMSTDERSLTVSGECAPVPALA